jgi:hypothetical protein
VAAKEERIAALEQMLGHQLLEVKEELKQTKKRKDRYAEVAVTRRPLTEPEAFLALLAFLERVPLLFFSSSLRILDRRLLISCSKRITRSIIISIRLGLPDHCSHTAEAARRRSGRVARTRRSTCKRSVQPATGGRLLQQSWWANVP